jgi:DNA polymerase V
MTKGDNELKFGQALKEARLTVGLSQEELALESELDRTYVSMLERNVKNPTLSTISKLAKSVGITPLQLISRSQQLGSDENAPPKTIKRNYSRPPLFGTSVSCGKPLLSDFEIDKELSLDDEFIKQPGDTFFLRANGDSMSPTIWDGDTMIISVKKKPQNNHIVLAQIDNELTIKRYFKTNKGIKLVPDNSHFKEISITEASEGLICGVVTGLARNL